MNVLNNKTVVLINLAKYILITSHRRLRPYWLSFQQFSCKITRKKNRLILSRRGCRPSWLRLEDVPHARLMRIIVWFLNTVMTKHRRQNLWRISQDICRVSMRATDIEYSMTIFGHCHKMLHWIISGNIPRDLSGWLLIIFHWLRLC